MIKSIEGNSKSWILSKYSRWNAKAGTWITLDSSNCVSPITLRLTPSCHLVINYDKEIQECINLWNSKETFQGLYKGASMLLSHKTKEYLSKFRIKFLSFDNRSADENCLDCINVLKQYFSINSIENNSQLFEATQSQANLSNIESNKNIASKISLNKETFTHDEMAKMLLSKTQNTLPIFFQNNNDIELDDKILKEFIMYNLFDASFPSFVEKVEKNLNELIANEIPQK